MNIPDLRVDVAKRGGTFETANRLFLRLRGIADGRAAEIGFAECYRDVYALVMANEGDKLRGITEELLRKLSLAREQHAYLNLARKFSDIVVYGERIHVLNNGLKLYDVAVALYARPVAARWRRVRLWALWTRRIAKWRLAFVHTRFMPGGSATHVFANEFYALATVVHERG